MKDHIEFEVHGADREEVHENALKEYRKYLGNPEANLPSMTRVNSEPFIREADGSITLWRANVEIVV